MTIADAVPAFLMKSYEIQFFSCSFFFPPHQESKVTTAIRHKYDSIFEGWVWTIVNSDMMEIMIT